MLDFFRQRVHLLSHSRQLRRLQSQAYWKHRRRVAKAQFEWRRILHHYTQWTGVGRNRVSLLLQLVRLSLGPLLLACTLFLIALLLERADVLIRWALVERLLVAIRAIEGRVDLQVYASFLSVVASVAGIFLGLYFAAATTVIGSAYVRAPKSIRELVIMDPAGSFYVTWLSFVTMLALLFLSHVTIARSANLLGFGMMVLLAAPTGFVAFTLGRHTLGLLDPSNLMQQIRRGWRAAVSAVAQTSGLGRWPEGQDFNRRSAAEWSRRYADLIGFCAREPNLREGPLQTAAASGLAFLAEYQDSRLRIPSQSRWTARLQAYGSIYLALGTELDVADASGTLPGPRETLDHQWFDRGILDQARQAFEATLKYGPGAPELVIMATETFQRMAAIWECSLAAEELIRWREVYAAPQEDSPRHSSLTPALADSIGNAPIGLVLGFSRSLERFTAGEIHGLVPESDVATAATDAEKRDLPPAVRFQLEDVQRRAKFEVRAEGREVTPPWVRRELLALAGAQAIERNVKTITALGETYFLDTTLTLRERSRYAEAAVVLVRSREFLSKVLGYHLGAWEGAFHRFTEAPVNSDLPWPKVDWGGVRKGLTEVQRKLEEAQATLIFPLSKTTRGPGEPDYKGIAVHESGKAVFDALRRGDDVLVKRVFPLYLSGSFALHGDLRGEVARSPMADQAILSTEPVADAIELSGLAFAWSEFHQQPLLWEPVRAAWDIILDPNPNLLAFIDAALAVRRMEIRLAPRSAFRMGWRMTLEREIQGLPRKEEHVVPFGPMRSAVEHPSSLIRRMGDDLIGMLHGGDELFAVEYLRRRKGGEKLSFGLPPHLLRAEGTEESQ